MKTKVYATFTKPLIDIVYAYHFFETVLVDSTTGISTLKMIKEIQKGFLPRVTGTHHCTTLWITNKTQLEDNFSAYQPKIVVTPEIILRDEDKFTKTLQKITTCPVVTTFDEDVMPTIMPVMSKFRQNIVTKFGGLKPKTNEISDAQQPVLWVTQENKKVNIQTSRLKKYNFYLCIKLLLAQLGPD